MGKARVYRFAKKDEQHALLLKLVLIPSNLRTAKLLIEHGFLYEWSIIRRSIRETTEDIFFLLASHDVEGGGAIRERYLDSFYSELIGSDGSIPAGGPRAVPRPKIRQLLYERYAKEQGEQAPDGELTLSDLARGLYAADSGHVHGRAAAILQLYNPKSKRFETDGESRAEGGEIATKSLWLMTHLCLMCFATVGGSRYGQEYRDHIFDYAEQFRLATHPKS